MPSWPTKLLHTFPGATFAKHHLVSWRFTLKPMIYQTAHFLSWVWIEMPDEETAEKAVNIAKLNGTPIRWGKPGYRLPNYIRIAVRSPELTDQLLAGWRKAMPSEGSSPVDATAITQ